MSINKKKPVKKPFKNIILQKTQWGNSVLLINLKHWRCTYCGNLLKDDIPFGIIKVNSDIESQIFCSFECLKIYTLKREAQKVD